MGGNGTAGSEGDRVDGDWDGAVEGFVEGTDVSESDGEGGEYG